MNADTMTIRQQIRQHIRSLGWAASRRSRRGEWFVKSSDRAENQFKGQWSECPIFFSDAEALASMYGTLHYD